MLAAARWSTEVEELDSPYRLSSGEQLIVDLGPLAIEGRSWYMVRHADDAIHWTVPGDPQSGMPGWIAADDGTATFVRLVESGSQECCFTATGVGPSTTSEISGLAVCDGCMRAFHPDCGPSRSRPARAMFGLSTIPGPCSMNTRPSAWGAGAFGGLAKTGPGFRSKPTAPGMKVGNFIGSLARWCNRRTCRGSPSQPTSPAARTTSAPSITPAWRGTAWPRSPASSCRRDSWSTSSAGSRPASGTITPDSGGHVAPVAGSRGSLLSRSAPMELAAASSDQTVRYAIHRRRNPAWHRCARRDHEAKEALVGRKVSSRSIDPLGRDVGRARHVAVGSGTIEQVSSVVSPANPAPSPPGSGTHPAPPPSTLAESALQPPAGLPGYEAWPAPHRCHVHIVYCSSSAHSTRTLDSRLDCCRTSV